MSEFTNHKEERVTAFVDFTQRLIAGAKGRELMEEYRFLFHTLVPADIITAVDRLFQMEIPLEDLKVGINKMLNLFQIRIKEYPALKPEKDSFLDLLNRNNAELKKRLAILRPKNTQINRDPADEALRKELLEGFREVEQFIRMYEIKENVLFPALEKHWDDWRCVQVMWSYHDDIRAELRGLIGELEKEPFDIKAFNKFLGDSYYNMHTIIFRDDYILTPVMLERMPSEVLAELTRESRDQEFPFVRPARKKVPEGGEARPDGQRPVDLGTGVVTPEQIALMFNHLPVDITYVDENDEVRYFSSPKKRVFHRSTSIIGRKVQNCHPPDSVHIVEQIVEAFRKGEKDEASFWIHMRDDYLLIRYFAVRDTEGKFRGVLEVTQEIGEIQKIEGEKRLLDWNDER
jgi:DUF438 domain-containing protein